MFAIGLELRVVTSSAGRKDSCSISDPYGSNVVGMYG